MTGAGVRLLALSLAALCLVGSLACCVRKPRSAPAPLRILALGDSYTIGEGVPEGERWPVQLAALLRDRGLEVDPPSIVARTGWTTTDLAAAIAAADLESPYDLVTLLIGVNDQYGGEQVELYGPRFASLLDTAVELAGDDPGRVIVLSIPDYSVTPFGQRFRPDATRRELDQYNALNRAIADRRGVRYVDVTPNSRQAAGDPTLLVSDGLHPSGEMYRQWAELVLPVAIESL